MVKWSVLVIVLGMIFFFSLTSVYSTSWTTFNNSLEAENVSYFDATSFIRYLQLPEDTVLISALFNITGSGNYNMSVNFTDNVGDATVWVNITGASGTLSNPTNAYDGDDGTFADLGSGFTTATTSKELRENYTLSTSNYFNLTGNTKYSLSTCTTVPCQASIDIDCVTSGGVTDLFSHLITESVGTGSLTVTYDISTECQIDPIQIYTEITVRGDDSPAAESDAWIYESSLIYYNTTYPDDPYLEVGDSGGTTPDWWVSYFLKQDAENSSTYSTISGSGLSNLCAFCIDENFLTRSTTSMGTPSTSHSGEVFENFDLPLWTNRAIWRSRYTLFEGIDGQCNGESVAIACHNGTAYNNFHTQTDGDPSSVSFVDVNVSIPSVCLSDGLNISTTLASGTLVSGACQASYWEGSVEFKNVSVEMNYTDQTPSLVVLINNYIKSCPIFGGNCLIPFNFFNVADGVLGYLDLAFDNIGFIENSQTYTAITTESATESFSINLTYDDNEYAILTAILDYNGTIYTGATRTGTGNEAVFTKSITIPAVTIQENRSFHWEILMDGISFNSTLNNQTVNNATLSLCGGTGGDVPYLNFTFLDESTSISLNASNDLTDFDFWIGSSTASQEYIVSNTTENPSYAFCFSPSDKDVVVDLTFKYSASGYPIRTFQYDAQTLTNSTTNQALYLLGSSDGIYSTIQATEVTGTPISGVNMVIERQFSGVWTIVGQAVTGSDGMATFWVNPNFDHKITATKTSYTNTQVTITPSQSLYTLIMSKSTGDAEFSGSLEGMSWTTSPPAGYLAPGTYNFAFNLTANLDNLDGGYCKFELANKSNDVVATTTGGSSSGCDLGISYTHLAGELLYGKLYVDTTNTTGYILIDSDQRWTDIEGTDVSTWSTLFSFFSELKDLDEWGEGSQRQEWNRTVIFFLFLTLGIGIFSFFTQWDAQYPGAAILMMFIVIMVASFSGWFYIGNAPLIEAGYDKLDKYVIAMLTFSITAAWFTGYLRRTT